MHTANAAERKPENKNATWVNSQGAWITYILAIVAARFMFYALGFETVPAWTYWHLVHAVVMFYAMHWKKGNPLGDSSQGKHDRLTLWEQIDSGVQWTPARKFFTLVPIVMFAITSHHTNQNLLSILVNTVAFVTIVVAKMPFMIKKRIFGINS
eukprot:TRINITY_DN1155_c0_g1_i1.p1 TRINITY_DN1155_c0_g1~~TRINITY_DN1155_c0_g1_i1.p1  ORF type:complete len:154 (+),score=11.61 TRINITY_DN1155_c0_g1_i1:75-536(+)